ncbi:MAG: hypothetical protein USCAAHI_03057 [Beijerinckiaceae bacterium]|nr:MAG: hypothetical protein USCAAHI_03057 [Beijerinckiaceae bacterium]
MPQGHFEETRAFARLPNLDIEIVHGRSADGNAEHISISLQAVPSFAAFGNFLEATNPFLFWMRFAQTAWAPGSAPPPPICCREMSPAFRHRRKAPDLMQRLIARAPAKQAPSMSQAGVTVFALSEKSRLTMARYGRRS